MFASCPVFLIHLSDWFVLAKSGTPSVLSEKASCNKKELLTMCTEEKLGQQTFLKRIIL